MVSRRKYTQLFKILEKKTASTSSIIDELNAIFPDREIALFKLDELKNSTRNIGTSAYCHLKNDLKISALDLINLFEKTIIKKDYFNSELELKHDTRNANKNSDSFLSKENSIANFLAFQLNIRNKEYIVFIFEMYSKKPFLSHEIDSVNAIIEKRNEYENKIILRNNILVETLKSISDQAYSYNQKTNRFSRVKSDAGHSGLSDYTKILNEIISPTLKKNNPLIVNDIHNKSYIVKTDDIEIVLLLIVVENINIYDFYVLASKCENTKTDKSSILKNKFHLTKSEIKTVELLHEGNNVTKISEILKLRPSSIRQRLKQIYQKTSVNGQVELINFFNSL